VSHISKRMQLKAVSLDPKYYKAMFLIGYAYIELRREDKQREFFEKAFVLANELGDPVCMMTCSSSTMLVTNVHYRRQY